MFFSPVVYRRLSRDAIEAQRTILNLEFQGIRLHQTFSVSSRYRTAARKVAVASRSHQVPGTRPRRIYARVSENFEER